ncbi:MAG: 30S ribosome-binding factor RbfA [Phycisphaerae bacterium]|nr:30S ribosome-binding factor RbfA [Phycisphaerae bacterium]
MSRRTERVGNLIRNTLGSLFLAKLSDPRVDPARVSITRVETPEDLLTAKVYISVAGGDKAEESRVIAALRHAAGYLQEKMMKQIQLRNTPRLDFQIDEQYKKTLRTLNLISEVSEELRLKDQARAEAHESETPEE